MKPGGFVVAGYPNNEMSTLHKTLRTRTNVLQIIGGALVCCVLLVFMKSDDDTMPLLVPTPFFFVLCRAMTGLVCGLFQSEAIRRSTDAFVAADSLMSANFKSVGQSIHRSLLG
jgi:hypothetical protein